MTDYTLAAELIKSRVSMEDAVAMYCPGVTPRHNRIPCPIHNGKDPNLWFSNWGYHCFVCGAGGDVINFVEHIFGLDFPSALDKLNTDFCCGAVLDRRMTLREQREAKKRHEKIMAERQQAEAEKQAYQALYNSLWDEWIRLDRNRRQYAPKHHDEEPHPLYVEAIQKIGYQEYLIDTLL